MMTGEQGQTPTHYLDWAVVGKSAIWRYALALALIFIGWLMLPALLLLPLIAIFKVTPQGNFLLQYSFVPAFILLPLIVRYVLGRPAWSIATPVWPPRLAEYGHGLLLGLVISFVGIAASYPFMNYHFEGFSGLAKAGMVVVVVLIIGFIVQTAFEELLFRGLIAQFTRRIVNFLPLIIGLQALLFGALHLGNVKAWGDNLWGITPYVMTAITLGWTAWRTGSLFIPAALHFSNNAGNTFLIGTKGDIIQSMAPLIVDTPTISQAVFLVAFNAIVTGIIIEAYMRWRATFNIAN